MKSLTSICTAKVTLVLGTIAAIVFPSLAGLAMQAGLRHFGLGLWCSAAIALGIALLAYLSQPHRLGAFEQADLSAGGCTRHNG
jgi:ABC-type thiamin/hydroxymethylpyrimidine transport system permease subunit